MRSGHRSSELSGSRRRSLHESSRSPERRASSRSSQRSPDGVRRSPEGSRRSPDGARRSSSREGRSHRSRAGDSRRSSRSTSPDSRTPPRRRSDATPDLRRSLLGGEDTTQRKQFKHSIGAPLRAHHFDHEEVVGEENDVCHDLIKCCSQLEQSWSASIVNQHNGTAQNVLQESLETLKRADHWREWWDQLAQSVAEQYQTLAMRLYRENSSDRISDDGTDPLLPIGTSRLHEGTQSMVHQWTSPKAANLFVHAWKRVWQALLEFRIEGICAPFTTMYCIEGTYVSVTALPPLRLRDRPPITLPGPETPVTMLAFMAEQLMSAVHIPPSIAGIHLAHGIDGRHYIVSLKEITTLRLPAPFQHHMIRSEALLKCFREKAIGQAGKQVMRVFVPHAVEQIARAILRRRQDDRTVPELLKDNVVRNTLHDCGVNICLVHHIALTAHHRLLETQEGAYRVIIDCCNTEMAGRVLKTFVRIDMRQYADEGRDTVDDRLDVVNRIARLIVTKDMPFWLDHFIPALRSKYHTTDTFDLHHSQIHLSAALKIMSSRIGCEYSAEVGRFVRFAPTSGTWMVCCKAPDYLSASTPRTPEQLKEEVVQLWRDAEASDNPIVRRAHHGKAMVASVLVGAATTLAKEEFERSVAASDIPNPPIEARMVDIRTMSIMMDMKLEAIDRRRIIERYVARVMKFPSGNFEIDAAQTTVRLLQAANGLRSIGEVLPMEIIEGAMRQFLTGRYIDFTFSHIHAQALVHAEQAVPQFSPPLVGVYLRTVESIRRNLGQLHGDSAEAKYAYRAVWALVDAPVAEEHEGSTTSTLSAYDHLKRTFGYDDHRTVTLLFVMAIFSMAHIADFHPEIMELHDALRRVIATIKTVSPANQIVISRSGVTLTILQRMAMYLRRSEVHPMQAPAAAIEEFLKRHGTALFAALYIQRVGRGFDDRHWMSWLRREMAARKLERVGRGFMVRRNRAFVLFRRKVMKLRTRLLRYVQKEGRGYLVRLDMRRVHLLRNVLTGAFTRQRLGVRRVAMRVLQRVGRGLRGRLIVAAPFQTEILRRAELDRQRRVQLERERLAAAADRCRARMLEVQKRLIDTAWSRVQACEADNLRERDAIEVEERQFRERIRRMRALEQFRMEETAARRKDIELEECRRREEDTRRVRALRRIPNLIEERDDARKKAQQLPPVGQVGLCADPDGGPFSHMAPPPLWMTATSPEASAVLFDEEAYQRKLIARAECDARNEKMLWGRHCRLSLARHIEARKTSLLASLQRSLLPDEMTDDISMAAMETLLRERSARAIQCAWRSNMARFRARWEALAADVHRRALYARYVDPNSVLKAPMSAVEKRHVLAKRHYSKLLLNPDERRTMAELSVTKSR